MQLAKLKSRLLMSEEEYRVFRETRRATLRAERMARADDVSEPRHRQGRGELEGPLQESRYPTVDGVRGDWLDDDGVVLPQYRKTVAMLRQRREMSDIRECALSAIAQSGRERE